MARRTLLPPPPHRHRVDTSLAIVNIVLLLVFFFLATGSLMNSPSFNIALSETTELPIDLLPQPILILEQGGYALNGDPIDPDALAEALIDDPILHVLVDGEAPVGALLELMAREDLFATEIRLVTLHLSGVGEEG